MFKSHWLNACQCFAELVLSASSKPAIMRTVFLWQHFLRCGGIDLRGILPNSIACCYSFPIPLFYIFVYSAFEHWLWIQLRRIRSNNGLRTTDLIYDGKLDVHICACYWVMCMLKKIKMLIKNARHQQKSLSY